MPNKFDKIAEKKKRAALAKQDEDVERFAGKVAGEVLGGIGDLSLKDSVAEFATSVAQAVVMSNETLDASLKDNFSQLLSAVKDNKPDDTSHIELSKKIGKSLANIEKMIDDSKLSPEINLTALSQEELRTELGALLARLPQDSQRIVTVAYENATPDKYLNVRLTDGLSFYKAGIGAVVAGGGTSGGLTDAELRASAVTVTGSVAATVSGVSTEAKQDTIIGHVDGLETAVAATNTKLDTLHTDVDGIETLIGTTNTTLTTIDSRVDGLETSTSSIDTKTPSLGQALAAASTPVVLTAAQEAALTPPAAITGFATSAKQDTLLAELQLKADLTETQPVSLASVPTHAVTQSGTWTEANSAAIKTAVETLDNAIAGSEMQVDVVGALPAGTNAIGKLAANSGVDIGDVDVTSLPVAFNAGTLSATTQRVVGATGSTSTQTQVADSASSQTILAANTGRIRATIVNDSTEILYLRESSSAATTTAYTWKVPAGATVIIDDYNGALTGIWAANGSGQATVSEVTA